MRMGGLGFYILEPCRACLFRRKAAYRSVPWYSAQRVWKGFFVLFEGTFGGEGRRGGVVGATTLKGFRGVLSSPERT